MSDQERFDWDDDMDFESLADEHTMSDESLEDLSDYNENLDTEPPAIEVNEAATKASSKGYTNAAQGKKLGISGIGMGLKYAFSVLVAGFGLAGGVVFVADVDPMKLWNPAGLIQVDQWFNIQTYPLNVFYILAVGIVALAVLGSWAMARSVRSAESRHQTLAKMMEKITALRLDRESSWQNDEFKSDPKIAAFVAETLGSWRLQMARQKKSTGLEGELHRLQKAVETKSREDLVGQYDNPFASNLAEAMVQLFDEAEAARNESKSTQAKDENESSEILSIVQDARSWNKATREKMSQQGVAVDKLASQLTDLGTLVSQLSGGQDNSQVAEAVADITREVEVWNQESGAADHLDTMNDLVDRGSKLAFQMAMEVARLGTRGERLLPMTQSLEELSNEFRQVTTQMGGSGNEAHDRIQISLKQVQERLNQGPNEAVGQMSQVVKKLLPSANTVSQNLADVAQRFSNQGDRLTRLGESFSSFTGVSFKAEDICEGNPDNPPEGGLNLTQHDPFAATSPVAEPMTDVDPFSQADNLLAGTGGEPEDSGFQTSVTPGQDEAYPEPEATLPLEDEKVYDLMELGAVPLDDTGETKSELEEKSEVDAEKIYDLEEFGAVSLT